MLQPIKRIPFHILPVSYALNHSEPFLLISLHRRVLRLSFQSQARLRQYKRLYDSFMKEYGREPSEAETAAHMGLSIDQVRDIHKNVCIANMGSLGRRSLNEYWTGSGQRLKV
ncbi:sigma-70 domain-containing protein [Lacrimispora sp. AGF001]|uniref:sigma-70 domain-containing protein n=1 Tax=Lacrimispora sp. AGF001 TaxID=3401631 RepID=UPI003B4322E2